MTETTQSTTPHSPVLMAKLKPLHRRWRWVLLWRGLGRSFVVAAMTFVAAAAVDYFLNLGFATRVVLAFLAYGIVGFHAWRTWLWPCLRPFSPLKMAWILEDAFPTFNEELISSVELVGRDDPNVSFELLESIFSKAEFDLDTVVPVAAFPLSWRHFHIALAVAACLLVATFLPHLRLPTLLGRTMLPSVRDPSIGNLVIALLAPLDQSFNEGDTVTVQVELSRGEARAVELMTQDQRLHRQLLTYNRRKDLYETVLSDVRESFQIWAQAGEVKSRTHTVVVRKRPAVEGFRITYHFPGYTKLEPLSVRTSSGDMKALKGTRVTLEVASATPLASMKLFMDGREYPMPLKEDGLTGKTQFIVNATSTYTLRLFDTEGLANLRDLTYRVVSVDDDVPTIVLLSPERDLNLDPDDQVELKWNSADDFGVQKQELVVRFDDGRPRQTVAYDPREREAGFRLADLDLKAGSSIEFFLQVEDASNHRAESERRHILVGGGRLLRGANAYLGQIRMLKTTLTGGKGQLREIESFTRLLGPLQTKWGEGEQHYVRMRLQKERQFAESLRRAQALSTFLKTLGFFPKNALCADLLRRYFEQERLFTLTAFQEHPEEEHLEALHDLILVSLEMTDALEEKASQYVAAIELPLLKQGLLNGRDGLPATTMAARIRDAERGVRRLTGEQENALALVIEKAADDAALAGQANACLNLLSRLENENRGRQNDYKRIDAAIRALQSKIHPLSDAFAEMAAKLKGSDQPGDWDRVRALAEHFRETSRTSLTPLEKADRDLLAQVLATAAEEKDSAALQDVANAIDTLEADQELHRLKRRLADVQGTVAALQERLQNTPADALSTETEAARIDAAAQQLNQVAAELEAAEALQPSPQLAKMKAQSLQAGRQLEAARQALAKTDATRQQQAAAQALAARDQAQQAVQTMSDYLVAERDQARLARKRLEKQIPPDSARLAEARRMLGEAAAALDGEQTALGKALADLGRLDRQLDAVAENLRDRAARDIMRDVADLTGAEEKVALAALLDTTREDTLRRAAEVISRTTAANTADPEAQAAAESRLRDARDLLARAGKELNQAEGLLARHEADQDGRLPLAESRKLHDDVMRAAEARVPDRPWESVTNLDALRGAREDVERLRTTAKAPGTAQKPEHQLAVAEEAGQIKRDLLSDLLRRDPDAFARGVTELVAETEAAATQLGRDVREAASLARQPASQASLRERVPALQDALAAVEEMLPLIDAVADLHDARHSPLARQFAETVEKPLQNALAGIQRNQDALTPLLEAGEGIAELREQLGETIAGLAAMPPTPRAPAPAGIHDTDPVAEATEQLQQHVIAAEVAAAELNAAQEKLADQAEMSDTERQQMERAVTELKRTLAAEQQEMARIAEQAKTQLSEARDEHLAAGQDALRGFEDNIALGDFDGAQENLTALRLDLRGYQAKSMDPVTKTNPFEGDVRPPPLALPKAEPVAEDLQDGWVTPARFQTPRTPLSPTAEAGLQALATSDPMAAIDSADGLLKQALSKMGGMEEALQNNDPDQWQQERDDLGAAVEQVEAVRDALGMNDFPASRKLGELDAVNPFEPPQDTPPDGDATSSGKEKLAGLREQMGDYERQLARTRDQIARHAQEMGKASQLAEAAAAAAAAANATPGNPPEQAEAETFAALAKELDTSLAAQRSLPAADARSQLAEAVKAAQSGDWQEAQQLAAAAEQRLQDNAPLRPASVALPAAAKSPLGMAEKLGNQEAMNRALAGDFAGAEESMRELAQALGDNPVAPAATVGAEGFADVREAQMAKVPDELARAVAGSETAAEKWSTEPFAEDVAKAAARALAQDYDGASVYVDAALRDAKQEAIPALEKLAGAIAKTAAERDRQLAAAPERIQETLAAARDLAAITSPWAAGHLRDAENAALADDYGMAAENVTAAAEQMSPATAPFAEELAEQFRAADDAMYGQANEAAREGIRRAGEAAPEAVAPARQQAYERAATAAREAGQEDAAGWFDEAAEQQRNALSPAVGAAADALAQAVRSADAQPFANREVLQQAYEAALRQDIPNAADLAEKAAVGYEPEIMLARQLARDDEFERNVLQPLTAAAEATAANQFARAQDHLAAVRELPTEAASDALAAAEAAMQAVARGTLRQAYSPETIGTPAQKNLIEAAKALMNGNLEAAREQAAAAGEAGEMARAALDRLGEVAATANQMVAEPLGVARQQTETAKETASGYAGARERALAAMGAQSTARAERAQEDYERLQQAAELLQQGNVTDGITALRESLGGRKLVPGVEEAFLRPVPADAGEAGRVDPLQAARDAGISQVKAAAERARQAAENASMDAAERGHAQQQMTAVQQDLNARGSGQALAALQEGLAPAMYASEAASAMRRIPSSPRSGQEALATTPARPSEVGTPPPGQTAPSQPGESEVSKNMAQAAGNLQNAQGQLANSTRNMQAAGNHLSQAADNLDQAVAAATQSALVSAGGQPAGANGNAGDQGMGTGNSIDEGEQQEWEGAEALLAGSDKTMRKTQYSTYYRNATQRYLEDIAREGRKWERK